MSVISNYMNNNEFILFNFSGFSMFPFLRPGDRLVVKRGAGLSIKTGDVVLFRSKQHYSNMGPVVHRVVQVTANKELVTKGDNMPRFDPGVKHSDDLLGQAVLLIRNNRIQPLTKGLYAWMGRLMAHSSRRNLTPGLLFTRLKRANRLRR